MQNKTSDLIVELVLNALDRRKSGRDLHHEDVLVPQLFIREFKTVKIHMPRQSGHTTAAVDLVASSLSVLFVVPYRVVRRAVIDLSNKKYEWDSNVLRNIVVVPPEEQFHSTILKPLAVGKPFDIVIIDLASSYSPEALDNIKLILNPITTLFVELS